MTPQEIAAGALPYVKGGWADTESQARRVAEYAAEFLAARTASAADKPDLPEPPGLNQAALAWENTMREVGWPPSIDECMAFKDGYIVATNEGRQLLALQEATHKAALADERRKALEEAAQLNERHANQREGAGFSGYSLLHAARGIRALIDRKEPT